MGSATIQAPEAGSRSMLATFSNAGISAAMRIRWVQKPVDGPWSMLGVSSPAAEMRRVCIPGGTIVLVNHFTSENWALRFMEKRLAHLARHIGFHADFPLDCFLRESGLAVREIRPSNLLGYWRLLRCINEKPASNLC